MKIKNLILFIWVSGIFILPVKFSKANDIDLQPPCQTIWLTGNNVSCFGASDGDATLHITGGSGDFTITWSNGATGVYEISNLTAGYYDVSVKDNVYGCTTFDIINITEPDLLTSSIVVQNINCHGESTGSLELSVEGGTQPYSIIWSNTETTPNLSSLSAGTYTVTIIDNHSCETYNTATITEPTQALGSDYQTTNILCFGDSNGAIDLTVWGGTPPYYYNWNENTYNSQDLSMIPIGTYNVEITDNKGCQNLHSIEITGPDLLEMSSTASDNICFGETNGNIQLNVLGGTQPYTYSWANSEFLLSFDTPTISNLANNNYYVTVTDSNGCSINEDFEITSPTQLTYTISGEDVTALGGTDGQIYFSVNGGIEPYSYEWSNGVTTPDNPNVSSGLYEVTVLDMNSCSIYASIQIKEPLEALSFSYTTKNTTCHGSIDGEIYAYASGGTPPYLYAWSTGSSISYLTDLSAGNYILTLTDINNVQYVDTITISQPEPITFSHTSTEPTCYNFNNASIDLNIIGGTAPYRYYWYDPEFALAGLTQDIINIASGKYTVEVIDTMGCRNNYTVIINQPLPIELSINGNQIQCAGGNSGSLSTTVSGGTNPYSYIWSNDETTPEITSLPAGNYTVTVLDANNCLATSSATLLEPDPISINLVSYQTSCIDQKDGYIISEIFGGSGGYNYLWSNGESTESISNLSPGEYSLSITDIYGCESSETSLVATNEIPCLNIPNTFSPNADGINDTWVINNIELYPDSFMKVFNKWGTIVFESQSYPESWDGTFNGNPLPAGTYYYILSFTNSLETIKGTITIIK
ncbi:MAG: T9SS type B sorting domain-containing protein [Clostridia bacterium]|nr:T9SS type B sorting domain-containing protein [Clostridia bacterium]